MHSIGIGLATALALGLAACNQAPGEDATSGAGSAAEAGATTNPESADGGSPNVNTDEPDATVCGADKVGEWLGEELTDEVKASIREAAGHNRIRYIAPGDMVTMDFRPDRLNVETGTDNRIKLFRCG